MNPLTLVVATAAVATGALVQGSIGFGLNLVAAPVLVLLDPRFVPVPVIVAALFVNLLLVARSRGENGWARVRWSMAGALPMCIVGAFAVAALDQRDLEITFAVLVLLGVASSLSGFHPRRSAPNLAVAGAAAGFMGTTTGVGGPPMALLFQHERGPLLRASLLRFFLFTSVVALIALTALGEVRASDLGLALVLLPGSLLGYLAAPHLTRRLDHGYVRHAVLAVSAVSSVLVLVRALA
jgi:uncharacterized protein